MIEVYTSDRDITDYFDFDTNTITGRGDVILLPSQAVTHVSLNDTYEASLTHPVDTYGRWEYIVENAVIRMPSYNGDQLYRVKKTTITDNEVTATMVPIFYDIMENAIIYYYYSAASSKQAGSYLSELISQFLQSDTNYTYSVDTNMTTSGLEELDVSSNLCSLSPSDFNISGNSTNVLDVLFNTIIDAAGGEVEFDNFCLKYYYKLGSDNGIDIMYGKNLPKDGFTVETDITEMITRVFPVTANYVYYKSDLPYQVPVYENTDDADDPICTEAIESDNIDLYLPVKSGIVVYENIVACYQDVLEKMGSEDWEEDVESWEEKAAEDDNIILCYNFSDYKAAIEEAVQADFDAGLDKPKVTITAEMVQLQNTNEYAKYSDLETVSLGDTVYITHERLNFSTEARVNEIEYDSIEQKISSVTIGDQQTDYIYGG